MGIYCLYTYNAYFYFNSDKRSQILAYHPNILETLRRSVLELTNYICKYANKYISLHYNKGGFMRTANYTDLRANLKSYIDAVIDDYDTVVVNRGNGKGVVMISLDEYNSLKETEYIMSSPDTMEAIHKGEEDIKNGNFVSQNEGESIEDFLKRVACTE